MFNQLVCGTVGFDVAEWCDHYYPEECPQEWRFDYYCNDFRSALFAAALDWGQLGDLLLSADDGFQAVIEVDAAKLKNLDNGFLRQLLPKVAVWVVLPRPEDSVETIAAQLETVFRSAKIAIDTGLLADAQAWQAQASQSGWSMVWYPQTQVKPYGSGEVLVVRSQGADLRLRKAQFDEVSQWMGTTRSAAWFIEPHPHAADWAREARELSELMGLA